MITTSAIGEKAKAQSVQHRRGCLVTMRRSVKWFSIVLVTLMLLGFGYQTIATEIDRRTYSPRGQLYRVNGHQMHMICMGKGDVTVILQAGGGAESTYWYWVQNQVAKHTRVCAYDRAGLGWSEALSTPRDPITIVGELHSLLEEASVQPPYIMVGHSYGAVLARVYAMQYPAEVTGLVLVDSLPIGLVTQSQIDEAKPAYYVAVIPLWLIQQLGISRIILPREFPARGYPPEIVPDMVALHARSQVLDTDIAEKGVPGYMALMQASHAAEELGNVPLAVLWASESYASYDRASVTAISTFSSNSAMWVIEGANHGSILGTEYYAQQVSDVILTVIDAAHAGEPLAQ